MLILLSVIAWVAAVISGVAGIGGGTILIAALYAVGMSPTLAVPLHAAVQLLANFSRTLAYARHVDRAAAIWFFVSCAPLPFLTARWVAQADVNVIRIVLAIFIVLALLPQPHRALRAPLWLRMLLAGALNGSVGMVVGATGIVIAPFFLHRDWSKETTVGTLALCQTLGHGLKILAFASIGYAAFMRLDLLLPLGGAVVLGSFAGRGLMRSVSPRLFIVLFRSLMVVLAVRLAYSGLTGL